MSKEQNKFLNIFFMLTLIVVIILVGCGCNKSAADSSQPKTENIVVTDVAGREVEINGPVKKVVVNWSGAGGAFMTMSALLGEEVGDYVVGWGNSLPDYRFDMYEHYRSIVPKLNDIVNVGNVEKGTLNTENVLNLKPLGNARALNA
jgi:iron complex transport system substrate-binding protein